MYTFLLTALFTMTCSDLPHESDQQRAPEICDFGRISDEAAKSLEGKWIVAKVRIAEDIHLPAISIASTSSSFRCESDNRIYRYVYFPESIRLPDKTPISSTEFVGLEVLLKAKVVNRSYRRPNGEINGPPCWYLSDPQIIRVSKQR
jgi:hypothetical protein